MLSAHRPISLCGSRAILHQTQLAYFHNTYSFSIITFYSCFRLLIINRLSEIFFSM